MNYITPKLLCRWRRLLHAMQCDCLTGVKYPSLWFGSIVTDVHPHSHSLSGCLVSGERGETAETVGVPEAVQNETIENGERGSPALSTEALRRPGSRTSFPQPCSQYLQTSILVVLYRISIS